MPLLGAVAGSTKHIEVGTGVIDMRYENPLYLAEEAASLNQIARGRSWSISTRYRRITVAGAVARGPQGT